MTVSGSCYSFSVERHGDENQLHDKERRAGVEIAPGCVTKSPSSSSAGASTPGLRVAANWLAIETGRGAAAPVYVVIRIYKIRRNTPLSLPAIFRDQKTTSGYGALVCTFDDATKQVCSQGSAQAIRQHLCTSARPQLLKLSLLNSVQEVPLSVFSVLRRMQTLLHDKQYGIIDGLIEQVCQSDSRRQRPAARVIEGGSVAMQVIYNTTTNSSSSSEDNASDNGSSSSSSSSSISSSSSSSSDTAEDEEQHQHEDGDAGSSCSSSRRRGTAAVLGTPRRKAARRASASVRDSAPHAGKATAPKNGRGVKRRVASGPASRASVKTVTPRRGRGGAIGRKRSARGQSTDAAVEKDLPPPSPPASASVSSPASTPAPLAQASARAPAPSQPDASAPPSPALKHQLNPMPVGDAQPGHEPNSHAAVAVPPAPRDDFGELIIE